MTLSLDLYQKMLNSKMSTYKNRRKARRMLAVSVYEAKIHQQVRRELS